MVKRMQEWKEKHNAYHISSLIHILFGYLQKYALKILSYPEDVSLVLLKTSPENPVLPDAPKNAKAPRKIIHFCKWQETLSHYLSFLTSMVCSHMRSGVRVTSALGRKFLGWTPHPRMPVTTRTLTTCVFLGAPYFKWHFFKLTNYCMNLHFSTHCIDWEVVTCGNKQCPYIRSGSIRLVTGTPSVPCYL